MQITSFEKAWPRTNQSQNRYTDLILAQKVRLAWRWRGGEGRVWVRKPEGLDLDRRAKIVNPNRLEGLLALVSSCRLGCNFT